MNKTIKMIPKFLPIFLLGVAFSLALTPSGKISDSLLKTLKYKGNANVIISFQENTQEILQKVNRMRFQDRGHKITFMKAQLEQLAEESQQNVISDLRRSSSVKFQSFWISNQLSVQGASLELLQDIAANPEVREIREEIIFYETDTDLESFSDSIKQEELGWGLKKIEADQAWDLVGGNTGEGIVVGVISTGARHTHEALSGNYRTPYGWFDAIIRRPLPYDDHSNGRGTHVLATVVGSHGVGVAPGAQWAVCKGCEDGLCRDTQIIACGEWMLCPTLPNTGSPDCSKAPNIVTCSVETTRANNPFMAEVVNAWTAAGIIPIYGSGQSGSPSCKDTASPGDYENVIGVGITQRNYLDNVTESEGISYVSGRGPTADGRIKPDVTAPGQVIRSACPENDSCYRELGGNSVAAAHAAGTAALLLARNPDLTFDQIKNLLQDNADRNLDAVDPECRGDDTTVYPNNVYGYGRINARKALTELIGGSN